MEWLLTLLARMTILWLFNDRFLGDETVLSVTAIFCEAEVVSAGAADFFANISR